MTADTSYNKQGEFQWHGKGSRTPTFGKPYNNSPKVKCNYQFRTFRYPANRTITIDYSIKLSTIEGNFNSPLKVAVTWYDVTKYINGKVVYTSNSGLPSGSAFFTGTVEIPASECSLGKITQFDIAINTKCNCHSMTNWYSWDKCPAWYIGDPRSKESSDYTPVPPSLNTPDGKNKLKYQRVGFLAHESGDESHISFIEGSNKEYGYITRDDKGQIGTTVKTPFEAQYISNKISAVYYWVRQRVVDHRFKGNSCYSKWSGWTYYLSYAGVLLPPSSVNYTSNPVNYNTDVYVNGTYPYIKVTNNKLNPQTIRGTNTLMLCSTSNNNKKVNPSGSKILAKDSNMYAVAWSTAPLLSNDTGSDNDRCYSSSARWISTSEILEKYPPDEFTNSSQMTKGSKLQVKLNKPKSVEFDHQMSVGEVVNTSYATNLNIAEADNNPIFGVSNKKINYYENEIERSGSINLVVGDNFKYRASCYYSLEGFVASDKVFTTKNLEVLYCPCNINSTTDGYDNINYDRSHIKMNYTKNGNTTDLYHNSIEGGYVDPGSNIILEFPFLDLNCHLGNFNYCIIDLYKNGGYEQTLFKGTPSLTQDQSKFEVRVTLPSEDDLKKSSSSDQFYIKLKCCYQSEEGTVYSTPGDNNSHGNIKVRLRRIIDDTVETVPEQINSGSNEFNSTKFKMSSSPMTPIIIYPYISKDSLYKPKELFSKFKLLFIINEDENYDKTDVAISDYDEPLIYYNIELNSNDRKEKTSTYGHITLKSKSSRVKEFIKFINEGRTEIDTLNYNLNESDHSYKMYGLYIDLSDIIDLSSGNINITITSRNIFNDGGVVTYKTSYSSLDVNIVNQELELPSIPSINSFLVNNNLISLVNRSMDYLRLHCNFIKNEDFNLITDICNIDIKSTKDLFNKNILLPSDYLGLTYPSDVRSVVKKLYKLLSSIYYRVLVCTSYDKSLVNISTKYNNGINNIIKVDSTTSLDNLNILKYIDSTYRLPGHRFYNVLNKDSVEGLVISTESLSPSEIVNYRIFRKFTDSDPVYDYFDYLPDKSKSSFNNPSLIYSLDVLTSYSDQDYVDCGLMFESLKGDPPYLVFRDPSDEYFDNFLGYIHGLLTKML